MKHIQLIFTLLITLGGATLCFFYLKNGKLHFNWEKITQWGEEVQYVPVEVEIKIPESGIKTNELAIKGLHALLDQGKGNVAFSPMSTEMLLRQLAPLSDVTLSANIEGLVSNIEDEMPTQSNSPLGMVTLLVDENLPLIHNARTEQLIRVPFAKDRVVALADINNYITIDTKGIIQQALSTAEVVSQAKILGISALAYSYDWIYPMKEDVEEKMSFFPDSVSLPYKVSTITCAAELRYVKEEEYIAVALFYQSEEASAAPTCLMIVMPRFHAVRDFTQSLNAEAYSDIRRKLAEATPTMVELRMPSFELHAIPLSQKELLSKLGCNALFTQNRSMPYLTQEDCVLENVYQIFSYRVVAKPLGENSANFDQAAQSHSNKLVIDRPFFWSLGDLTTDDAPQLMGIIETLK